MKNILLFFAFLVFTGCSTGSVKPNCETKLIGNWQFQSEDGMPIVIDFVGIYVSSIRFVADGSFLTNASAANPGFKPGQWTLPDCSHVTFKADYKLDATTSFTSAETDAFSFDAKGRLVLTIASTPAVGGGTYSLMRIGN